MRNSPSLSQLSGRAAAFLLVSIAIAFVMPSTRSLWSDEASTATLASAPDLHAWYLQMRAGLRSEHQMPLAMLSAWLGARVLGTSEWALRAPNIAWAVLALAGLHLTGRLVKRPWLPLILLIQPFFWYYMDEARPYAMQIAAGSWLLFVLVEFVLARAAGVRWAIAIAISGLVLCGSSLLGVIPFCCCCAVLSYPLIARGWRTSPAAAVWLRLIAAVLFLLAVFYFWTLEKGAGGTRLWPVNFTNVAFAIYELAGFAGLGPGRIALRGAASQSIGAAMHTLLRYVPLLALLFASYVYLIVNWARAEVSKQERRIVLACAAVYGLSVGLLLVLAYAVRWPFWGRHLAAILPFQVLIVAACVSAAKSVPARLAAVILCALLSGSALELRLAPEHRRDDYRSAANVANAAVRDGKTVWWCANAEAANYYHVELSTAGKRGGIAWVENRTADDLRVIAQQAPPDLIVYTRANGCDEYHAVADFIRENGWATVGTAQAFTFYERIE